MSDEKFLLTAPIFKYGTEYDKKLWDILVSVTHWTEQDVLNEKKLRKKFHKIKPDYTINSFDKIYRIINRESAGGDSQLTALPPAKSKTLPLQLEEKVLGIS
ncbi:MAG: hypothetical protein GTN53_35020 [Candidatus Aminicenantes bacterium]|nr:hypothetical protein [Candidatus Aminicenantes bacterium]NIQ71693.1 hypothetical protein [Candidatus Aminicenantes bacterium]NIT27727.1 hypothetical protein [Candidatus Aminicenantes bacterium]